MNYSKSEIISAVKVLLDSHGYSAAIAGTGEGQYLDDIIGKAVLAAARSILTAIPPYRFNELCKGLPQDADVQLGEKNGAGNRRLSIVLPGDFLRLVRVRLTDWLTPVWEALPGGSPEEALQYREGVCANPLRPVAIFGHVAGGRSLDCWGSRATAPRWKGAGDESGWLTSAGGVKVAPFCFYVKDYRNAYRTPDDIEVVDVSGSTLEFDLTTGQLYKNGEFWTTAEAGDASAASQCKLYTPVVTSLIDDFRYVAEPAFATVDDVLVLAFENGLYQALLYRIAGMTAAQTQEEKLSEDLLSISNMLIS